MATSQALELRGAAAAERLAFRRPNAGIWSNALGRLRRDRVTMIAATILVVMVLLAVAADFLADNLFHYNFSKQDLLNNYQRPTLSEPAFWLGSDDLGRSVIVRLLYGARVSLSVGIG